GIAALGAIFEHAITKDIAPRLAGTPVAGHATQIGHAVAAGGARSILSHIPVTQHAQALEAVRAAFASAMNEILLVGAFVALAGAVLGLALVRARDFATYARPEAVGATPAP